MSNQNENRVLSRLGARELTLTETECVSGGFRLPLPICTFDAITCQLDGQPCKPPEVACGG